MAKILVIPGDGIGVEVTEISLKVLQAVEKKHRLSFEIEQELFGGSSIDKNGMPVTQEVIKKAKEADASAGRGRGTKVGQPGTSFKAGIRSAQAQTVT